MKSSIRCLVVAGSLALSFVFPAQAQKLPSPGTDRFPSAAGVTLDLGGSCSSHPNLLLTGPTEVRRGDPVGNTIPTEILSMQLRGLDANGQEVFLRAGSQFGLPPSMGQVTVNPTGPHDSFFDVFFEVTLGDGTQLVNTDPVQMAAQIVTIPPISHTFTNLNVVDLFTRTTTNKVGQAEVIWHHPARQGKEAKLGLSLDIQATLNSGLISAGVCPTNALPSAVYDLRRQVITGTVDSNSDCNELQLSCSGTATFEAVWDCNLRAPDWRGHHRGTWRILCDGVLLATGRMDGCNGIGTHRKPPLDGNCEECSLCNHFEGRLIGVIAAAGPHRGAKIEACYAGEFVDDQGDPIDCCPLPCLPPSGPFKMAVDGVAVQKCTLP